MPVRLTAKQTEALALLRRPQRHTMLVGGARSGKTFLLCQAILVRALKAPGSRHVILRFRQNAVWRAIGLDTLPKVAKLNGVPYRVNAQEKFFELPNGAQIWLGGLDDKERAEKILGMEFATIYLNEASEIPYASYLIAKTRLAQVCPEIPQRIFVDLNPSGKGHWTYRLFVERVESDSRRPLPDPEQYDLLYINPGDNAENLSAEFLKDLENAPERYRRRFFEGRYTEEIENALWPYELLDKSRCEPDEVPTLVRVVVSVDPSGARGPDDKRSDEIGIVVAAKGSDGRGYILADRSCKLGPAGWSRVAVTAYHEFRADCVVGERNYGGAMVEETIRTADRGVPFREVTASRGKAVRAEPIANLYAKDMIRHVGPAKNFTALEDQLTNFSTAGYLGDRSPDRADALVWGLAEVMGVGEESSYDHSLSWIG